MPRRAARSFFATDAETLAKRLIGQRLVRTIKGKRLSGTIVEAEAYLGEHDKAAHSYRLHRSDRNEAMYAEPGTAYVYFTYGMHYCMNIVAGRKDEPVAVLLRALEPDEGIGTMRTNRAKGDREKAAKMRERDLCSGPAKLCAALQIDRALNGEDLTTSKRLFVELVRARRYPDSALIASPRIGIDRAEEWRDKPLRWYLDASEHVSRR